MSYGIQYPRLESATHLEVLVSSWSILDLYHLPVVHTTLMQGYKDSTTNSIELAHGYSQNLAVLNAASVNLKLSGLEKDNDIYCPFTDPLPGTHTQWHHRHTSHLTYCMQGWGWQRSSQGLPVCKNRVPGLM
eukprot:TRINITY_DN36044_c0_g1_i1.p1 TRINITY_DN36044_c0_g1~~TRINITY_DN36044_c0_g1_i1.p1  ORF type:complete len:132 (+),score=13.53 TRINITY_DN36044_c0_g1_i1:31-426(+)